MATISPVLSRYHRLLFLVLWLCCWLLPPATPLMAMAADPAPRTAAERWRSFAPTMNEAAVNEAAVNEDAEVVYLDSNGFIRVWDPQPPTNESAVAWVSPEGGWRDLTLADVNGDGDLEILAVGGEAYTGRLVIYDPVLTEGAIVPDQIINTIPWATLFMSSLSGRPLTIRAGEFDPAIPGPELAIVYELNPEDKTDSEDQTRLVLWHAVPNSDRSVDGTNWEETDIFVDVGYTWDHLAVGDLDNIIGDEVVLVDENVGLVRVYRLEEFTADGTAGIELAQIYENKSEERPWLDGVVARFVPGVLQQMALTRSTGPGGNSLWVLFYDPNVESNFGDSYAEFLLPPPRHIFAGDVDDNGDDELFLLRDVPTSAGSRPHLIMRNYNNETEGLPTFELILDADNGYNAGTTGDVDGDGRAEVVIMRNNNLRVYTAPESGASTALNFVPPVATDQRVVQAGNLDRNGYLKIPELGVSPPQLTSLVVYSGETRTAQLRLTALATGAEGPIPFELSLPAAPSWLTVTPQRGETTANVTVQVDASTLAAGTYESTIVITSLDPTVANSPFRVDVAVTVLPGLVVETKSLLVPLTCGSEGETTRRTLTLNGPTGLIFSATVGSGNATALLNGAVADPQSEAAQQAPTAPHVVWPSTVPWVTAASSNILPTTMELTFHGNAVAAGTTAGNTTLELVFFDKFGRQLRTVALGFFCADHQQYLPLIRQ